MADPAYIVDGVLTDGDAWVALATSTLTGTTTSVTLSDPEDGSSLDWSQFQDLVLIWYARSAHAVVADRMQIRLGPGPDASTTPDDYAHYDYIKFNANNTTATGAAGSSPFTSFLGGNFPGNSALADAFGGSMVRLFDVNSGKWKSALFQTAGDSDGAGYVSCNAGTWREQGPVKQVQFFADNGSGFLTGSRFDVFGVLPRMVTA